MIGVVSGGVVPVSAAHYAMIFGGGVIWATGTLGYSSAVQLIGLSRSTPIKNTTAILGTVYGIAIFHEFGIGNPLAIALAVAGSLAVVGAATLLGRVTASEGQAVRLTRRRLAAGVGCSVWAALAYSLYIIPMKITFAQGLSPQTFLFYMGQGCFVGMSLMALVGGVPADADPVKWRDRLLSALAGVTWAVASICANAGVKLVGVAITWPTSNLNTVIAVGYGVLILRETNTNRHRLDLRAGLGLAVLGVALLALAMRGH